MSTILMPAFAQSSDQSWALRELRFVAGTDHVVSCLFDHLAAGDANWRLANTAASIMLGRGIPLMPTFKSDAS